MTGQPRDLAWCGVRHIGAALKVETARKKFAFEWERVMLPLGGKAIEKEQILELIGVLETFSMTVREAVEQETAAWVAEFQSNLAQLEKETRTQFETAQKERLTAQQQRVAAEGAIAVRVKNFAELGGKWELELDGGKVQDVTADSVLIKKLAPGPYHVVARGMKGGVAVQGSETVELGAGKVERVELRVE